MDTTIHSACPRPRRATFMSRIMAALAVRRQRVTLGDLSDDVLRDIGITRAEALREARRPLWDAPSSWRR